MSCVYCTNILTTEAYAIDGLVGISHSEWYRTYDADTHECIGCAIDRALSDNEMRQISETYPSILFQFNEENWDDDIRTIYRYFQGKYMNKKEEIL